MKLFALSGLTIVLLAAPAMGAGSGTCLNPNFSYEAKPADNHDVIAQSTLGANHARMRLSTTCIDLHDADVITLNTSFLCVGKGDSVIATGIDGRRQHCIVTSIVPETAPNTATH
jgi:hypothetical protein